MNGTQAQTSTDRRANTPKSTQTQKCKQAGRPLLAKSISGLVFQYRQSSKRDPQRRRNTTQPFRSTWLRYRRTPNSDLVHRAGPVCEKFPISRKKESLQSGHHVPREDRRAQVTVHGSGTDAFSRRKTNIFHGRDQTRKRRLSVKMGLSPSLARERLPAARPQDEEWLDRGSGKPPNQKSRRNQRAGPVSPDQLDLRTLATQSVGVVTASSSFGAGKRTWSFRGLRRIP